MKYNNKNNFITKYISYLLVLSFSFTGITWAEGPIMSTFMSDSSPMTIYHEDSTIYSNAIEVINNYYLNPDSNTKLILINIKLITFSWVLLLSYGYDY
jgi:hypothetical protein